jgi:hypothetical protein
MRSPSRRELLVALSLPFATSTLQGFAPAQAPGALPQREAAPVPSQPEWRWCRKCQGLWFSGNPVVGTCPAGGGHDKEGSRNYRLFRGAIRATQANWRWCRKCQGLWFNGNPSKGACPVGGTHESSGSGNYFLVQEPPVPDGQDDWRWCRNCQGLWFAGNRTAGACPSGGGHEQSGSSNYVLARAD